MSDVGEGLRRGAIDRIGRRVHRVLGGTGMIFHVPSWLLPAPSVIWTDFVKQSPLLGKHIVATASGALGGLVVGAAAPSYSRS